jgi:hypothetical protein
MPASMIARICAEQAWPALQFDCVSTCINQASGTLDSQIRAIVAVDREVSHDKRSRHRLSLFF